jgi:hypothetical protein
MANALSGHLRRMDQRAFNLQDQPAPFHSGTTQLVSFDSEIRTALDIELLRISESGH